MEEAQAKLQIEHMNKMADMLHSLPTFARDEDENQWKSLTTGKRIYDEQDITDMQEEALKLYYTDPSARGIIDTMVNFVLGKEAHITPNDESEKVVNWWNLFCEENEFDMRMKELVRRCFRDGEAFLRFFKNKKLHGVPLVRFVEPDKISDRAGNHTFGIETDPDDVETVIRYHLKEGRKRYIRADDMIHIKINVDSNVKRGVSYLVGIAKYIVKYGGWLDDRIMLNKIRTMFNMIIKVTGITPAAFNQKFTDVTGKTTTGGTPKKQIPKSGSVLIATPGLEYEFKNLNIHAEDTKEDGRLIELQVGKGTNLTEYVVRADSSNSNYSSTMISESPMVRMFESWQDIFEKPFKKIYKKVMERGIKLGEVPKKANTGCSVNFAALIHRDLKDETEAYISQITSGIVSKKTIAEKFGYDYDSEQEQIEKELEEESNREFSRESNENNEEEE